MTACAWLFTMQPDPNIEIAPMRLIPLVCVLLLTACKSSPFTEEIPSKLELQVRTFEDVVRWGALEKMYAFLKLEADQEIEIQPGLENIRVTNYELGSPIRMIEPGRWTQTAVISYVLTDRQVLRQLVDQQIWVSEEEDVWYRENPVPQFR